MSLALCVIASNPGQTTWIQVSLDLNAWQTTYTHLGACGHEIVNQSVVI